MSGIYEEMVTMSISSDQVGNVPRSFLTILVRIGVGRNSSVLAIFIFRILKNTYFLYKYTRDICGHICACCDEEEPPYAEKQRNTFRGLNVTLVACGNILNVLKVKVFQMQTGFVHITAKSWMMWLNTENV